MDEPAPSKQDIGIYPKCSSPRTLEDPPVCKHRFGRLEQSIRKRVQVCSSVHLPGMVSLRKLKLVKSVKECCSGVLDEVPKEGTAMYRSSSQTTRIRRSTNTSPLNRQKSFDRARTRKGIIGSPFNRNIRLIIRYVPGFALPNLDIAL
jgi:hypothetical protein